MGYKIAEFRKKMGMTQEQLAKQSGVSRQTIISLETNAEYNVKSSTLLKIASALHTTVHDLFLSDLPNKLDDGRE